MKPGKWLDWLLIIGVVLALANLAHRYVLPRASVSLEGLETQAVAIPGRVTLLELAATHCLACVAMQPIVGLVAKRYGSRIRIRVLNVDQQADRVEVAAIAEAAHLHYTPTFLVTDVQGVAVAKFIGPTSYAALATALDRALQVKASPQIRQ